MTKFMIVLEGANYLVPVLRRRFLLFKIKVIHEGGFFTTRFVEAHSQESACAKVIGEVLTDLNASGMLTEESRIEVIKIVQPDVLFDRHAPGDGYVFYTGDGRQTALDIESGAF